MRTLAIVLGVLGVLAAIAAILYFALPAHDLPGFLPGHVAHVTGHRNRRGIAAAVVAVVLFLVAWMVDQRARTSGAAAA